MSRKLPVGAAAICALLVLPQLTEEISRGHPGEKAGGQKKAGTRTIPLNEIYATTRQARVSLVRPGSREPYGEVLTRLFRQWGPPGASNVFLVRGKDFETAVKATYRVLWCALNADFPGHDCEGRPPGAPLEPLWLVAYLGTAGSEPPGWLIHSAEQSGATIRLSYVTGRPTTNDGHEYLVWVPLGHLDGGIHTLELFNHTEQYVTLMRRVQVSR